MSSEPVQRPVQAPVLREIIANLAMLALFLVIAWFQLGLHLGGMFEDDAYFYFRIARNVIAGVGVSFDGFATTNGFHLAWMAVLVAALAGFWPLFPFDVAVVLASALPVLVFAFSLRPFWFICVLASLFFVGFGMEGVLAAALAIGLCRAIDAQNGAIVGAFAATLVLARIDLLILLGILLVWFAFRRDRLLFAISFGMALGLAGHIAVNLWLVGEPFSVSSTIKANYALSYGLEHIASMLIWNFSTPGNQIRLIVYAVPLVWIALHHWRGNAGGGFAAQPAFLFGNLAFLGLHAGLSDLRDWYFAVPVLTALWAAGRTDRPSTASFVSPLRAAIFVPSVFLPLATATWYQVSTLEEALAHRTHLENLDHALPQDAPLFVYDASGFAGHVLWPRPVINGDGLVNTFDYLQIVQDSESLFDYLKATGTRHFLSELANPLCLTHWTCCSSSSVSEIMSFPPNRWKPEKRAWVFREGYRCELSSP